MRRFILKTAAWLLGAIAALSTVAHGQEIAWITDYSEALAQAKQSGKPIFLTFRCVP